MTFLSKSLLGSQLDRGAWVPRQVRSLSPLQVCLSISVQHLFSRIRGKQIFLLTKTVCRKQFTYSRTSLAPVDQRSENAQPNIPLLLLVVVPSLGCLRGTSKSNSSVGGAVKNFNLR